MFFDQTVVILRAPVVTDKYNNRTYDWSDPVRRTVARVSVQPAGRGEIHDAGSRDRVTSDWVFQTPPGVDVDLLATDRIELAVDLVCEVVGEVARHTDPFGRGTHHVEANLQRVTG